MPQQRQVTPRLTIPGVDAGAENFGRFFLQEGYTQEVTGKLILKLSADHYFNKACGKN